MLFRFLIWDCPAKLSNSVLKGQSHEIFALDFFHQAHATAFKATLIHKTVKNLY